MYLDKNCTPEKELELLKNIIDNMTDAVFIYDSKGIQLLCNEATVNIFNCSRETYIKEYTDENLMVAKGICQQGNYHECLKRREAVFGWSKVVDSKGNGKMYYIREWPIFDAEGEVKYIVGTSKPQENIIQEYKTAMEQLNAMQTIYLKNLDGNTFAIYRSPKMGKIFDSVQSYAATDATILIQGETGTGKDVLARFIHSKSNRSSSDMVSINCATISTTLFETEMFGYVKGAFTGADASGKAGLIEQANKSTLYLDEVDSLPLEQQGKLLRVLETHTIRRVGSNQSISTDFRLIVATNKDLKRLVKEGTFREDLYYRLNVVSITIPPLRDRQEDIRLLAEYYLDTYCKKYKRKKTFHSNAYEQLKSYSWPGNVRELKNFMERVVLTSDYAVYEITSVKNLLDQEEAHSYSEKSHQESRRKETEMTQMGKEKTLPEMLEVYEQSLILKAMESSESISEAAKKLGVSVSTISRKVSKYTHAREDDE